MKHHRNSVRLLHHDYSQEGAYFVTICTKNREPLFGTVEEDSVVLNAFGRIVESEWRKTGEMRHYIRLDEHVVMPNHFHGIIVIEKTLQQNSQKERFGAPVSGSLSNIVRLFKQACTIQINRLRGTSDETIWQRNYYEHIVRNDKDLHRIREYIVNNPLQWSIDEENPDTW